MDPTKSLDFSQYPKITQPDENQVRLETQKRSQGINNIRSIMENLLNALQSYLIDIQEMDSQARLLEQQKMELIEIDKQLRYSQSQLENKEKGINEQLDYIKTENTNILEKKLKADTVAEERRIEFNDREKELILKEEQVDAKIKQAADIQIKLDQLKDQQTAIDSAAGIDRERKQLLDKREQNILVREARLARLESESKIG